MKTLCIGMMVYDVILSPIPDDVLTRDSVSIKYPVISPGGDAFNVSMCLSKLGNTVSIVGRVGDDPNGKYLLDYCKKNNIDTTGVIIDNKYPTATSFALIDNRGERHFLTHNEIFSSLDSDDISDEQISTHDIIYFGSALSFQKMDKDGTRKIFSQARKQGKLTVMDAAINDTNKVKNFFELLAPVFECTDIFFPSIDEARYITRKRNINEIVSCFKDFSMKAFGLKLGADGYYITNFIEEKKSNAINAFPIIDTTGAGDAFMAGFITGYAKGWSIFDCADFANVVAAHKISSSGGISGVPNFDTSFKYYKKWKESKG